MWKAFQEEIDKLFSKVTDTVGYKKPFSEISQDKNLIKVKIQLPHIDKKDIILHVYKDNIEIRAEIKKKKVKKGKGKYESIETYKGYYRRIPIPINADYEKAKAVFKKNLLLITIPKKKKIVNEIKVR